MQRKMFSLLTWHTQILQNKLQPCLSRKMQAAGYLYDGYNTYPWGSNEAFCWYNSNTDSLTLFHRKAETLTALQAIHFPTYIPIQRAGYGSQTMVAFFFDPLHQNFTNYIPNPANAFNMMEINIKENKAGNLWCTSAKGLYFDVNTKQF